MKPTQVKELLANIRASLVSFVAIMMFALLGVGIFAGIYWMQPAIKTMANQVFDAGTLYDIQVQFPYGLTDTDLEKLAAIEGVSQVETARQTFAFWQCEDTLFTIKLQSLTEKMNTLEVLEGRAPQRVGEMALNDATANSLGVQLGDTIEFEEDDSLQVQQFEVVGIATSAEYLARSSLTFDFAPTSSGITDGIAWVSADSFKPDAFNSGYPVVFLRCDELRNLDSFSQEYQDRSTAIEDWIVALGDKLSDERYRDLHKSALQEVAEGDEELAEAREQIAEGQNQIDEANEQIRLGREQLAQGERELEAMKGQFTQDGIDLGVAGETISAAERDLQEKAAALEEMTAEVEQKSAELESARADLEEQAAHLEEAREQVEEMQNYQWSVLPRSYNGGYAESSSLATVTGRLSFSMAALFVIVGLLVTYSAVSRLVHEQVIQIGTKKALGLRRGEITASFLAYAGFAVVAGSLAGLAVGVIIVENIVGSAIGHRFTTNAIPPYFDLQLSLLAIAVELGLVLFAAWVACRNILRRNAVELLRGGDTPKGKTRFFEKWALWERLPLFTQTIVNNCLNDRQRVLSTIVGVAGCTALVVTALTLNNNVQASYERQYRTTYHFDTICFVDEDKEGALEAAAKVLQDQGLQTAQVVRSYVSIQAQDGGRASARIVVVEDEDAFRELYSVHPPGGNDVELGSTGVWATQAFLEHQDFKVEDMLQVNSSAYGTAHAAPIAGFFEYYLSFNEVVMSKETYESFSGWTFNPNAILIMRGNTDLDTLRSALASIEGFEQVIDDKAIQGENYDAFSEVSRTVVMIYMVLATLMAIVVLLNLNIMFIEEKKRELIVLIINGFSTKQAKRYVYNDTIVLTFIGIVIGLVLGAVMGSATVASMEVDTSWLYRGIDPWALLIGAAMSSVLSFAMSAIALRRVSSLKLTDINKL